MIKIAPSILSCDFTDLRGQIRLVEEGGADYLHIDVMDGHFVPNITFGPVMVKAVKRISNLPCDVHLMIADPDFYLEPFANAGTDICTVHIEVLNEPLATFERIRALGMKVGLTLNPNTPVEDVLPYVEQVDQILVMSVNPGFSGQKFMPIALEKTQIIASASAKELDIEIDGGISLDTISAASAAGANVFVAATAIFKSQNIPQACKELRAAAQAAAKVNK